ncbi:hypothetical protein B5V01_21680 [Mesorhizobium erdmanii]|uniref:Uncharacterized protein n=3 Tax=Phyllobacteriaceae TaxID=69277 RepID=A0A3M9X1L0_9HYPH|nr:hypothetical protein DNR46_31885 [Mesorhizobium japonicum]RXT42846.1 hypothetical protein B5V01_21680 [Mesorhizobium erdmanii]
MALWFSRELSAKEGNATQELLLDDVSERVEEGANLAEAIRAVGGHDPRAGDFGVEVVGSVVAIALLEGLKVFWAAYIKELEEKAGTSLADATLEFLKSKFKHDVAGPAAPAIEARIKSAISDAAAKVNIDPAALTPAFDAVGPTVAAAGATGD